MRARSIAWILGGAAACADPGAAREGGTDPGASTSTSDPPATSEPTGSGSSGLVTTSDTSSSESSGSDESSASMPSGGWTPELDGWELHCKLVSDESVEDPDQRAALPEGTEVLRIAGPMFFGVAGEMLDALNRIGRTPRAIILRLDRVPYLDSSGVNVLETFVRQAKGRGLRVILCDMPPRVRETLTRATPRFAGAERVRTLASAITRLERTATTSE